MRRIKLIALDLDDTLLAPDLAIPAASVAAVHEAWRAGVPAVIATGRMWSSARPYAEELGLNLPLIAFNGALVKEVASGKVLLHEGVPRELAQRVVALCARRGWTLNVYLDDGYYVQRHNAAVEYYETIVGQRAEETDLAALVESCSGVEPNKLLIVADEAAAETVRAEVAGQFEGVLHVMRSRPRFIEIVRQGVDKWRAIQLLAAEQGIADDEIMAMGDSANDLEMISHAGLGVTVPHATDLLKATADYVTEADDGLGVAEAIRKFVL